MTAFDSGPIEGSGITEEDFAWFKRRFYELMDWDPETGEPTGRVPARAGAGSPWLLGTVQPRVGISPTGVGDVLVTRASKNGEKDYPLELERCRFSI